MKNIFKIFLYLTIRFIEEQNKLLVHIKIFFLLYAYNEKFLLLINLLLLIENKDISADLIELGKTPVCVISAGAKVF